jgi:hypothetical protein
MRRDFQRVFCCPPVQLRWQQRNIFAKRSCRGNLAERLQIAGFGRPCGLSGRLMRFETTMTGFPPSNDEAERGGVAIEALQLRLPRGVIAVSS